MERKNGMERRFDAVTLGEVMLRLSPADGGRLLTAGMLERYPAGAEMNVAVGLSQLGNSTALITKLPQDANAGFILSEAGRWGVSREGVVWDGSPSARTGIYYFETASAPRKPAAVYDRKNSSINSLRADELPKGIFSARLFHTSGITLGLGSDIRREAIEILRRFRENGAIISFDVNYRAALWQDWEEREVVEPLFELVDVLFVSEESLRKMFGKSGSLGEILPAFAEEYRLSYVFTTVREVVSPQRHNFTAVGYGTESGFVSGYKPYEIDVVDRVGSGDAFVSGALDAILSGGDTYEAVRRGCAMAAAKCTVKGDIPCTTEAEISSLISSHESGGGGEMVR